MLELPKIIIISKFYQSHAKISTPTGATAPVKKVKEISSNGPLQTNQSGTKRSSKPLPPTMMVLVNHTKCQQF